MTERRRGSGGDVTVVRILFQPGTGYGPRPSSMSLLGLTIVHAGERRLAAGHPQLPLSDAEPGQRIEPGRPVRLLSLLGQPIGVGVCDPENQLIRVWDVGEHKDLGASFFRARVRRALALRQTLGVTGRGDSAYRLVNAEGDGLSGLSLDVYGAYGVVTALSRGLTGHARLLAEAAREELTSAGLALRGLVLKTRTKTAAAAEVAADEATGDADGGSSSGLPGPSGPRGRRGPGSHGQGQPGRDARDVVLGEVPPAKWTVLESGIPYEVHLRGGYNVGLFTDMREHRAGLARFVRGARVLNTFAYTGSLSLAAVRGEARSVTSVDLAPGPLAWAQQNFRLSGIDPEAAPFRWEVADVFRFLEREQARQAEYDVVILDPPTVSGARATSWAQKRDYPELVAAAARLMPAGGHLWVSSNTHGGPGVMKHVEAGLELARRWGAVLELGGLPPDYPTPLAWPSARYLEVCQVRLGPIDGR
jgi:23S rRNA (cytosine1962-C5)-methyltransferase